MYVHEAVEILSTILGIIVLSRRDKQFTLPCKIDLTDPINEPRQCVGLCFDNFEVWCTTNCFYNEEILTESLHQGELSGILLIARDKAVHTSG
jgi:hypothetical protein